MQKKHCCKKMGNFLEEGSVNIYYDVNIRSYAMGMKNGTSAVQIIYFCPWCGKKLPKNLHMQWFKTLEDEYGITCPFSEDRNKVPKEFKTDEWWKKRGF